MLRIVPIALLSCLIGQAAPPAAQAGAKAAEIAEPTIVGIVHHGPADPAASCAEYLLGHPCRDMTHWTVSIDAKEHSLDTWSAALKDALAKRGATPPDAAKRSDLQAPLVLLAVDTFAPWQLVARVEAVARDAGIRHFCTCDLAAPPKRAEQVVIDVVFDFKAGVDHRKRGATDVTASQDLVDVLRDLHACAWADDAEPLVRIRVEGPCSWSTVTRTLADCREAGVTAVDVATRRDE